MKSQSSKKRKLIWSTLFDFLLLSSDQGMFCIVMNGQQGANRIICRHVLLPMEPFRRCTLEIYCQNLCAMRNFYLVNFNFAISCLVFFSVRVVFNSSTVAVVFNISSSLACRWSLSTMLLAFCLLRSLILVA